MIFKNLNNYGGTISEKVVVEGDVHIYGQGEKAQCLTQHVEAAPTSVRKGGRTPEPLCADGNAQERAVLFVDFLKEHKAFSREINTRKDNYINRAFAVFYREWLRAKAVPTLPNGSACFRFLKEDCSLSMTADMKTYGTFIRGLIAEGHLSEDMELSVESFLLRHNKQS
ncbi:MAG: hypothetical protein IJ456_09285 [Bacteroides sp.]|nr:hypothetical protein [Bacteroides sp.]